MSTHAIEIIEIGKIEPHPDPEVNRLELTHIWGWQCCIGKGQFKEGDKAIYVPPDYLCKLDRPEFAFLRNKDNEGKATERIKVRRLRGALSQGLVISVPEELKDLPVGSNVIEQLEIERYEPPLPKSTGGMFIGAPSGLYCPKFDLECLQRYMNLLIQGETVILTEKLNGSNSRYVYAQNKEGKWKQFCGSHTNWMAEDEKNIWWIALRQTPDLGRWCQDHPNLILFGEVFGHVKRFWYKSQRHIAFAAFAILDQNRWIDYHECQKLIEGYEIKWAPFVWQGPFDFEKIREMSEGPSLWLGADNIREGVVVVPEHERTSCEIGRIALKSVSDVYLEMK